METLLLWGMGLVAFGLVMFLLELVLPSGGVIGALAALSMIGGCVAFWMEDPVWGIVSTVGLIVFIPLAFHFALKVLPYTPMGRSMILGSEEADEEEMLRRAQERSDREAAQQALVGAEGEAVTDLRRVGIAVIDGVRIEVLAEGGPIDRGERVRVSAVEGNQVRVRRIT